MRQCWILAYSRYLAIWLILPHLIVMRVAQARHRLHNHFPNHMRILTFIIVLFRFSVEFQHHLHYFIKLLLSGNFKDFKNNLDSNHRYLHITSHFEICLRLWYWFFQLSFFTWVRQMGEVFLFGLVFIFINLLKMKTL